MKKHVIEISVLLVLVLVACVVTHLVTKTTEDKVGDNTSVSVSANDVEDVDNSDTAHELPEKQTVAIDVTDSKKMLFEYLVEELTAEELTWCINATLSGESIAERITEDVVDTAILDIKSHADDGTIYMVLKASADETTQCLVNVCTYADRINPIYSIKFVNIDGVWSIS